MTDHATTPAGGAGQAPGATPPAASSGQQPPGPAAGQAGAGREVEQPAWVSRAGTILTCAALGALAMILLDIAFKGRLLGPLFARLPAAPAADPQEGGGDPPRAAGE